MKNRETLVRALKKLRIVRASWLMRRWQEFRWGHGVYLVFTVSLTNFLLITYRFLIEQIPFLESLFPNLAVYVASSLVIYVPLAIIVGHLYRTKQLETDIVMTQERNPYILEVLEQLKVIEGQLGILLDLRDRGSKNEE